MIRKLAKRIIHTPWDFMHRNSSVVLYMSPTLPRHAREGVEATADFFEKCGLRLNRVTKLSSVRLLTSSTSLTAGEVNSMLAAVLRAIGRSHRVDPYSDPFAARHWHETLTRQIPVNEALVEGGRLRLMNLMSQNDEGRGVVYIFGTGPSLDLAIERSFDTGVRVVCNTAVRNTELLLHLRPHIITAGDALYHFSNSEHARQFRKDLYYAIEAHSALFVFPEEFAAMVQAEMPASLHWAMVPIPNRQTQRLLPNLWSEYSLPNLGNVLNRLLLPLAISLGRDIRLLGFDGRRASDQGFWKNSARNSYPELLAEMQKENPAFTSHYVPTTDPEKYSREILGSALAQNIDDCERGGWQFSLLAPSAIPGLANVPMWPDSLGV